GGSVRVAPPSTAAVAGVMGMAHDTGWRVTVEGAATWRAEAAPADLILSTRALDDVDASPVEPGVIRVGAGAPLERVRRHTLDVGGWIPLDPPGRPDRTVGAVLSTGTDGPLRLGVGGLA